MASNNYEPEFLIRVFVKIRRGPEEDESRKNDQLHKIAQYLYASTGYRLPHISPHPLTKERSQQDLIKIFSNLQAIHQLMKNEQQKLFSDMGVQSILSQESKLIYIDTASGNELPYDEYERRYAKYLNKSPIGNTRESRSPFSSPRSPTELS